MTFDFNNLVSLQRVLDEDPQFVHKKLEGWKQTPLMEAIFQKNKSAVELLLKYNSNVNAQANNKLNALMVAVNYYPTVIPLLIEHGAILGQTNTLGWNELGQACYLAKSEAIHELLKFPINLNKVNNVGDTALSLYVSRNLGNAQDLILLLKAGLNINHQNNEGYTPLMYSVVNCPHLITTLLENGADVDIQTHSGKTLDTIMGPYPDSRLIIEQWILNQNIVSKTLNSKGQKTLL